MDSTTEKPVVTSPLIDSRQVRLDQPPAPETLERLRPAAGRDGNKVAVAAFNSAF